MISGTEALLGLLSDNGPTRCPEKLVWAVLMALIKLSKNARMAFLLIRYGMQDVVKLTVYKVMKSVIILCNYDILSTNH